MVIKIGLKGMAKYMTSNSAQQRRILRDYKNPDPEGIAQAAYYRDARDTIRALVRGRLSHEQVNERISDLASMAEVVGGASAKRLRNNSRALNEYVESFGERQLEWVDEFSGRLVYGDVRVSVVPDLYVRERERVRLIKLEYSKESLPDKHAKVICQAISLAAAQAGMELPAAAAQCWEVHSAEEHKGARIGKRLTEEIEAACENIQAIWPTI